MDAHQAYCLNFPALTNRWGRGPLAIAAAWGLSVLGITLTVAAAWLLGERLAIGPSPVDLRELSRVEFWVAVVVSVVNYLWFFRFFIDADAESRVVAARAWSGARLERGISPGTINREHVTTHYSAPEIGALIEASEKVCALRSRKSPALAIVRARPIVSA